MRVPAAGAGSSASTLSVEISTIVSSAATASPGCLCHSRIVALGHRLAGLRHDDVDDLAVGGGASRRTVALGVDLVGLARGGLGGLPVPGTGSSTDVSALAVAAPRR